jgi:hypothetical protein
MGHLDYSSECSATLVPEETTTLTIVFRGFYATSVVSVGKALGKGCKMLRQSPHPRTVIVVGLKGIKIADMTVAYQARVGDSEAGSGIRIKLPRGDHMLCKHGKQDRTVNNIPHHARPLCMPLSSPSEGVQHGRVCNMRT